MILQNEIYSVGRSNRQRRQTISLLHDAAPIKTLSLTSPPFPLNLPQPKFPISLPAAPKGSAALWCTGDPTAIGVYGELPRVVLGSLSTLVHLWLLVLLSLTCHMLLPPQLLFWHPLLSWVLHLLHLVLFNLGNCSLVRLMLPKVIRSSPRSAMRVRCTI